MTSAQTICSSGDTSILYPKKNKPSADEMALYWRDIQAADRIAESSYRGVSDCAKADLIVKITLDILNDSISFLVTDGDSGDSVFSETRAIQDKRSDLIHAAQHFHDAVKNARIAVQEEQARLQEEYRREQETKAAEKKQQQCQTEFDDLKRHIIAAGTAWQGNLPQNILDQITTHNQNCTNPISVEIVALQQKAEADAKAAQEQLAREQATRDQRLAQLEKEKADALAAWKQQLVAAPFVPPLEGWTREAPLGSTLWYIILPKAGFASNCHFAMNGSRSALDCLGGEGRNDYVSVINHDHWYLLKAKRISAGDLASTVKDGGLTLCLRQAGCHRVLAELRPEPTELPDKLQVAPPADLSAIYSSEDVAFNYPQNWRVEEKKNKDNIIVQVNVTAPDAHLANWVTHGFFLGHVLQMSDKFPHTLDGAYDQFISFERQRGLVIADARTQTFGDSQGKLATYTSPSVFRAGESGWVAVVKDRNDGYYYLLMFYPTNDDASLYTQTFNRILATFKFKK